MSFSDQMNDKEIVNDSLASQKLIGGAYFTYSNECVNPNLKRDFLSISKEESDIGGQLFSEMQQRGWVSVEAADEYKVSQTKQKFQQAL